MCLACRRTGKLIFHDREKGTTRLVYASPFDPYGTRKSIVQMCPSDRITPKDHRTTAETPSSKSIEIRPRTMTAECKQIFTQFCIPQKETFLREGTGTRKTFTVTGDWIRHRTIGCFIFLFVHLYIVLVTEIPLIATNALFSIIRSFNETRQRRLILSNE